MKKISVNNLKKIIKEEVKKALMEDAVANPSGGGEVVGPFDMSFQLETSIAYKIGNLVQLMTNVGALIDNPNQSRPSLTGTIRSGDRARETMIVRQINRIRQQIVSELRFMASDNGYGPRLRQTFTYVLAIVRNVHEGMRALNGQPAETQIAVLQSLKMQYISAAGILRRQRNRFSEAGMIA